MKEWKEITYYVGFDWAHDHHDVVIVDRRGQIVADFEIQHTAAGWQRWNQQVAALGAGAVAVCVETSQGLIIEQLLESGVNVYPIAPVSSKAYRERKASSGTKTDRLDAWSLADALRLDGQGWKVLAKEDPLVAELRLLCRDEVALIEERTALVNQLQSALEQYYPAAREAFEDWTLPGGLAFVEAFPTPTVLRAAGQRKWEKFLHVHKLARPQTYGKRLEIFARANELVATEALTRTKSRLALARTRCCGCSKPRSRPTVPRSRSSSLNTPITNSSVRCREPVLRSPHACWVKLAPTAPALMSPALCKLWPGPLRSATSPARSTKSMCAAAATSRCEPPSICGPTSVDAPLPGPPSITKPSGPGGKSHAGALPCLGQRWLKILSKMWHTRRCYHPDLHTPNQLKHGSWILQLQRA